MENIGYMDGSGSDGSSDDDTETTTGNFIDDSESGTDAVDTDAYIRVPFLVSNPQDYFYFRVNPEDNEPGFYGGWYAYADGSGTMNQMYFDADNNACARGHVAQYTDDMPFWTFAGLGVGVCYEPEVSTICYTLNECPYIDALDAEVVGVAFGVINTTGASLRLQFLQQASSASTYIDSVNTEDTLYLFEDSVGTQPASPTDFADVSNVQVQVENSDTEDVEFDICLLNFSLIMRAAK